ncbi:hypothetical protein ABZP36_001301 [Zizania latifolia]
MDEDDGEDMLDIESRNYDDLDSVSKLQKTQRGNTDDYMMAKAGESCGNIFTQRPFVPIFEFARLAHSSLFSLDCSFHKVEYALEKGTDLSNQGSILEEDPEYQLIVDCNALSVYIDNEIIIIHNFMCDKYRLKFPELESLVQHPIDYARVVKKIGNEMDLTLVDLEGLLPSAIIMIVSNLAKAIEACDKAFTLDAAKKKVLDFVESKMGYIQAFHLLYYYPFLFPELNIFNVMMYAFIPSSSLYFQEKSYGSSGASLAFTPVQGIELSNPQSHGNLLGSGTQSTYFSETGTFSKIKRT